MKKKILMGITALATVCFTACKEYDISKNFSEDTKYADEFIEEFGTPDPLQDWSMATTVTLDVTLGDVEDIIGGVIKVYSDDPYSENARILATKAISGYDMSISFEVSKSNSYVYVLLQKQNGFVQYKPAMIEDGKCETSFECEEPESHARGAFNTASTTDVKFWEGEVPAGQYDKKIPDNHDTYENKHDKLEQKNFNSKDVLLRNAEIGSLNTANGNVNIWIQGNCTIDEWSFGDANPMEVYVLPGANLTVTNTKTTGKNATWTICSDAHVTYPSDCIIGEGQKVYNNGVLDTKGFSMYGNAVFYNDNKLNCLDMTLNNSNSVVVNNCEINLTHFSLFGSSHFYNNVNGIVNGDTHDGTTTINSNNSTWFNRGLFVTGGMVFNSTSCNWINECKVLIYRTLTINLGDGSPMPVNKSYIKAKKIKLEHGGMTLGPNAQLIAEDWTKIGYCTAEQGFGLKSTAEGNDYAIFKSPKVAWIDSASTSISYVGNLIVDCDSHFKPGGGPVPPYIKYIGKAGIKPGGDGYTIIVDEGDKCNEPYGNGTPPTPPVEDKQSWIMACEDLGGNNDYDFNDVVFSISHMPGEPTAIIKPLAAGGTLASILYYNDQPINRNNIESEIHNLLGYEGTYTSGSYNLLNTSRGHSDEYKPIPVTITLTEEDRNATIEAIAQHISVRVVKRGTEVTDDSRTEIAQIVTRPEKGAMPQILLVPDTWIWPVERTSIKQAYPNFEDWVYDSKSTKWESNAVNSKLVKDYPKRQDPIIDDDDPDPQEPSYDEGETFFSGNVNLSNYNALVLSNWNENKESYETLVKALHAGKRTVTVTFAEASGDFWFGIGSWDATTDDNHPLAFHNGSGTFTLTEDEATRIINSYIAILARTSTFTVKTISIK